ncbi:DUF1272 domain-containing protein [Pseudomonas oryzihabitans]|uniref:DUF1272 domain-containing protein n=1 Tax=Pseudomonas oryzihabitans TaxID=47885 RepID=A0ABX3IP77_9PSED|nr:DUF1272 domain-containing protein [Pseudomonas psychrotolerans]
MLDMRTSCEHCAKALPMESEEALICSYECTFCAECAVGPLQQRCPNCQGELLRRPRRVPKDPED